MRVPLKGQAEALAGIILIVPNPGACLLPTLLTNFTRLTCASGSSFLSQPFGPQHSAQLLFHPVSPRLPSNQALFLPGHVKILQILSSQIQEAFFLGPRSTATGPSTESRQH